MEKIKSKHQLKTEARNAEIKALWKHYWYRGALRTIVAEAVAEMYLVNSGVKISYSTVLRIVSNAK